MNQDIYRLKAGPYTRFEKGESGKLVKVRLETGNMFVPTDIELKAFKDKFELVSAKNVPVFEKDDFVLVVPNGKKLDPKELEFALKSRVRELFAIKETPEPELVADEGITTIGVLSTPGEDVDPPVKDPPRKPGRPKKVR